MSDQAEVDKLLQREWRGKVIPQLGRSPNDRWIPVFQNSDDGTVSLVINSVLIPNENVEQLLQTPEWGRHVHVLEAGFTGGSEDSPPVYRRFVGSGYGIEPLVIQRNFHGLKPDTVEILEEFRLYHNLYDDCKSSKLVRFDAGGYEVNVVKYSDTLVQVSRKELRQFLAARDMSMAVFVERRYHAGYLVQVSEQERTALISRDHFTYRFEAFDHWSLRNDKRETYSRLLAKTILAGLPREKCGIWPYEEEPMSELERFIIGTDENEGDILAYSSPYSYGAATTDLELPADCVIPDYLTKVFFERRVLDKYFGEPSKYSVNDGYLSCANKWGLQIDNNNPDYVIVWLGDLGRDLPFTEHQHWKGYNVAPDGFMSDSHRRSQLPSTVEEALDPGDPENASLLFRRKYNELNIAWSAVFGWDLFKSLGPADSHHLSRLRLPSTSEQFELEQIMLSLSIVLCESINIRKLKHAIPSFQAKDCQGNDKGSITILAEFLGLQASIDFADYIGCLRTVQDLRSTGAVHRKGKKYRKVAKSVGLDTKTTHQVADDIYSTLAEFLDSLREHFCPDDPADPSA